MNRRIELTHVLLALAVLPAFTGCQMFMKDDGPTMPHQPTSHLASPPPVDIAGIGEADLVEEVARHRQEYHRLLKNLYEFYLSQGHTEKARQAQREFEDLNRVKWYDYLAGAALAAHQEHKPIQSVPEADALYQDGLTHLKDGGHGVPLVHDKDKMKLALDRFQKLITEYPTSDKIDDAAFYCGEISKEYFNDNEHAVKWYEAAIRWNPDLQLPARFQAAVVYDYRMHDRDRALELYQEVLDKERFNKSNVDFAARRIRQLTSPNQGGLLAPLFEPASPRPVTAEAPPATTPAMPAP